MSLSLIHATLANTILLFLAILGIWALVLRILGKPLDASWFGTAIIAELLLIAESLLGISLWFSIGSAALPRPFLHILYAIVVVITLPFAYTYFSRFDDDNVHSLAMVVVIFLLWLLVQRTVEVARIAAPY